MKNRMKRCRRKTVSIILAAALLVLTVFPVNAAAKSSSDLGGLLELVLGMLGDGSSSSGSSSGSSGSGALVEELIGSLLGGETAEKKAISGATVSKIADQTYTGKAIRPVPKVTYDGKTLVRSTDYTLTYSNNTEPGTAKITIKGKGNYKGTKTVSFKIVKKSGSSSEKNSSSNKNSASTEKNSKNNSSKKTETESTAAGKFTVKVGAAEKAYTGKAVTTTVTVTVKGKKVTSTNYTISYKDNKNVGKATVTVTGKGEYKGYTGTATFKILPPKVSFTSVTGGEKAVTVKWKKTAQAEVYQIEYCTRKAFDKNVKRKTVKDGSLNTVIDGLDGGKNYYVRIRCGKKVGTTNWYSEWSTARSVKTK